MGDFGRLWGIFRRLWVTLDVVGLLWGIFGRSWTSLGHLWVTLDVVGRLWGNFWTSLGVVRCLLWASFDDYSRRWTSSDVVR